MSILQNILQAIYSGTHAPTQAPGPLAAMNPADAAALAPNTPGAQPPTAPGVPMPNLPEINRNPNAPPNNGIVAGNVAAPPPSNGILGTIGDVLAPQAGSFWASALKNGLAGARQGMIDDPLEHANMIATLQAHQAEAAKIQQANLEAQSGLKQTPTGDTVKFDYTPGSPNPVTVVNRAQAPVSAEERALNAYEALSPADQAGPKGQLLEMMFKNYRFTQPVIAAQGAAKTATVVAGKQAQKFAPRAAPKSALPPGFQ